MAWIWPKCKCSWIWQFVARFLWDNQKLILPHANTCDIYNKIILTKLFYHPLIPTDEMRIFLDINSNSRLLIEIVSSKKHFIMLFKMAWTSDVKHTWAIWVCLGVYRRVLLGRWNVCVCYFRTYSHLWDGYVSII